MLGGGVTVVRTNASLNTRPKRAAAVAREHIITEPTIYHILCTGTFAYGAHHTTHVRISNTHRTHYTRGVALLYGFCVWQFAVCVFLVIAAS